MKNKFLIITTFLIIIMGLTLFIRGYIIKNSTVKEDKNPVINFNFEFVNRLTENKEDNDVANNILLEGSNKIEKIVKKTKTKLTHKANKKIKKPKKENYYTFQLASYKDMEQAIYLKKKLENDFDNIKIYQISIEGKGIFYRVILEPISESKRESTKIQLEENYGIEPWIIPLKK